MARGQDKEVAFCEYKRRRRMLMRRNTRQHDNQPGQCRDEREADTQVGGQEVEEEDGGGRGGGLP